MKTKQDIVLKDEQASNAGRPGYWPNQKTVKLEYKGPETLKQRIQSKVDQLIELGFPKKVANKSNLQRICVEQGIDTVEQVIGTKSND